MSVSKWAYTPEVCDGKYCVGDCDKCSIVATIDEMYYPQVDGVTTSVIRQTDYIKREDAINACKRGAAKEDAEYLIRNLPSADVVEVVRCKDCIYQGKAFRKDKRMKEGGYYLYSCKRNGDPFTSHTVRGYDDEFCSYGERVDK